MTNDEEAEIRAYVAERAAARARGEHIDSDERREVVLLAALDEARAQLAALHAAASAVQAKARALPVSMSEIVHAEEWDDLERVLADLATAAAEHDAAVRADERAKALGEVIAYLEAESADDTRDYCTHFRAMADEAERGTR